MGKPFGHPTRHRMSATDIPNEECGLQSLWSQSEGMKSRLMFGLSEGLL